MTTKNILKWALVLSIIIVLNLFFNFAIASFYKSSNYEDFCTSHNEQVVNIPQTESECVETGGQWNPNNMKPVVLNTGEKAPLGWCDVDFTCREAWQTARDIYDRNVFVGLIILGLLAACIGIFVTAGGSAVSLGLSLGGALSFVIASIRYWSAMDDYLRVIILGLALITLIWVGIKKFKD